MFNLDNAIGEWRRRMRAAGIQAPALLDELESHLREDVNRQVHSGSEPQRAVEIAVQRMGQSSMLGREFAKVGGSKDERRRKFMRVYCVVFPILYSLMCAYGLLSIEMSLTERIVGFTAVALTALPLWCTPWFHKLVPVIRNERIRMTIQIACIFSWLVVGVLFMNVVLPRLELTASQIIVTVLWLMMPVATISGFAYGLGDAARRQTAVAVS
jgi:hypothetical protein